MSSTQSAGGSLQAIGVDDASIACEFPAVAERAVRQRRSVIAELVDCVVHRVQRFAEFLEIGEPFPIVERRQRRVFGLVFITEDRATKRQWSKRSQISVSEETVE
ncbi:hypothetical protein [Halogranum rubrum]|uniref:Uncharacterized protein n=1 Tax=Halogranum salarium B-1 TaxID=1210908 RepID=J2ZBG7_9EURY|nr:hypothetical protein [Halogranum salarium]EJN58005.1 hypothetical protein HSB1_34220 [Halogranum salarium B-1]